MKCSCVLCYCFLFRRLFINAWVLLQHWIIRFDSVICYVAAVVTNVKISDGTIYRIVSHIAILEASYRIHIAIITAETNSIFRTTLVSRIVCSNAESSIKKKKRMLNDLVRIQKTWQNWLNRQQSPSLLVNTKVIFCLRKQPTGGSELCFCVEENIQHICTKIASSCLCQTFLSRLHDIVGLMLALCCFTYV